MFGRPDEVLIVAIMQQMNYQKNGCCRVQEALPTFEIKMLDLDGYTDQESYKIVA
jgi:hypothetical protein